MKVRISVFPLSCLRCIESIGALYSGVLVSGGWVCLASFCGKYFCSNLDLVAWVISLIWVCWVDGSPFAVNSCCSWEVSESNRLLGDVISSPRIISICVLSSLLSLIALVS